MQVHMKTHTMACNTACVSHWDSGTAVQDLGFDKVMFQTFPHTEWSPASTSHYRHFIPNPHHPMSVSRLSLWNVYDSGAVDKLEIDLDWKANKIAKAQSQLKSSKREQRGGGEKESNRRKSINTGLALREHRVMSTSSTHTEYCAENADTPSRRAGWCLVLLSLIRETLLVERKLNCPNDANRKQQVHSSYLPARIGNVYVRLWVGWVCVRCQGKVLI